ncbi:hypothetical protein OG381_34505 [Streptomyces sp. NBC_00490]|uniref:hypothetical protein n=1 Tax=Streptomyces sp. NBC_00490 TaxID=2903657 RepID=UPI002E1787E6
MSENQKVTVQFAGTITYDAAPEDSEGTPSPTTVEGHTKAMAGDVASTLNDHLMYGESDLEPTDYVQAIHELTVTGVTPAQIERLARLEALVERAATLVHDHAVNTEGVTNLGRLDDIESNYESDAWTLVLELAPLARKGE